MQTVTLYVLFLCADSPATAMIYNSLILWSITNVFFFTSQGTGDFCDVLNYKQPPHQIENLIRTKLKGSFIELSRFVT